MPMPWPQYNPDDEGEDYQQSLAQSDQDSGIGDADPKKPKQPDWVSQGPASMPHSAQDAAAAGAQPPQMPNPSIWRRILAGGIAGMAGVANTKAGRPGGPSQPINAAPATANLLGTNDYQRKLANWQLGEKQKDAAATLERNRNEDALKYQESMARVAQSKSATALQNDTREQNAATRSQAEIDAFQKGKYGADTATRPDIVFGPPPSDNPPLQADQSNLNANVDDKNNTNPNAEQVVQAANLPETDQEVELNGMPQPPQLDSSPIPGMPNLQQPIRMAGGTKPGFSPAQAPKGYEGPPLFNADPAMQAQMTASASKQAAQANWHTVTQAELANFQAAGIKVPWAAGDTVDPQDQAWKSANERLYAKPEATPKPPPETENEWISQLQSGDPGVVAKAQANLKQWRIMHPAPAQPQTASPQDLDALATDVANYQRKLADVRILRNNLGEQAQLEALIKQKNPDFHEQYYDVFRKMEENATSGRMGQQAEALGVMMGHLKVLKDATAALHNDNVRLLNGIANQYNVDVAGKNPKAIFQTIVNRVGPEISKAYIAGGGTAGERGAAQEDFNPNMAPDIINGNIAVSAQLADSKIKAMQNTYKRGTFGRGQQQLIPDERELDRLELTGAQQVQMKAPTGEITAVPIAQAKHFLDLGATLVH